MPSKMYGIDEIRAIILTEIRHILPEDAPDPTGNTSFSALGMDSLSQVTLITSLEDRFGIELDPTLAYDYPTIDSLSGRLSEYLTVE